MVSGGDLPLAEYSPIGEYLQAELEARGWSHTEFADMAGFSAQYVSSLIRGGDSLTAASAVQVEAVTGIAAATWLGLQSDYQEWSASRRGDCSGSD